ncbi:MAG TPA: RNA polymerase sigma factor [Rhizomicrobium sp.]|nr:RNA polymerase sigma factor [Rhizomicrobium sp.]
MPGLEAWFVNEVLPLEAALMQFLRRSGRNAHDLADLRQEVYLRVCEAAKHQVPRPVRPFLFTVARNLMIDQMRRDQVIAIDAVSDLEALNIATDVPGPDRNAMARSELRRLQAALDELPPRCREVLILRRIDGLSRSEISQRMGITEKTVTQYLTHGVHVLANLLYAEAEASRRPG